VVRITARTLAAVWVTLWVFAVISSAMNVDSRRISRTELAIIDGVLLFVLLVLAVLPWRWESVGGILLILASMLPIAVTATFVIGGDVEAATILFSAAIGLTPLVAGALFVAHAASRRGRAGEPSQSTGA
jgi:hypothetical protein